MIWVSMQGMAMEHAACNRGIPCEKDVDCVPFQPLRGRLWSLMVFFWWYSTWYDMF